MTLGAGLVWLKLLSHLSSKKCEQCPFWKTLLHLYHNLSTLPFSNVVIVLVFHIFFKMIVVLESQDYLSHLLSYISSFNYYFLWNFIKKNQVNTFIFLTCEMSWSSWVNMAQPSSAVGMGVFKEGWQRSQPLQEFLFLYQLYEFYIEYFIDF